MSARACGFDSHLGHDQAQKPTKEGGFFRLREVARLLANFEQTEKQHEPEVRVSFCICRTARHGTCEATPTFECGVKGEE